MLMLKLVLILIALPLIVWLVRRTIRRARELDAKIDAYHEEQAALEKLREQGLAPPANPYADLAELYNTEHEDRRN